MPIGLDHQALLETYAELVAIACECCDVPELAPEITISWNERFTARMGDASWIAKASVGRIRLSLPLWPKASTQEQDETVVHEACHIIADYRTGQRQSHGKVWREMMQRCGYAEPRRCHKVDDEGIQARRRTFRVPVRCGCPTPIYVSRVAASKISQGADAVCKRCRQRVAL